MTEKQSLDESIKKNILLLEEEGFSIIKGSVYDIIAEKHTLSGKLFFYLTRDKPYFRSSDYINNIALGFRSNIINTSGLNAEIIHSNEKQLNLITSISKKIIAALQARGYSFFFQQVNGNENLFRFGRGDFVFELSFYINQDRIGAKYYDASRDNFGMAHKYKSLFETSKEDVLDRDINFLHDMYLKTIKSKLSRLVNINI